jgi:hypothetical protein
MTVRCSSRLSSEYRTGSPSPTAARSSSLSLLSWLICAAIGDALDQAVGGQVDQGLTQAGTGHLVRGGQFLLDQALTRCHVTGHDRLP